MYHLSKVHDSHNIHFTCRIWGLRATDLNQGVVYGSQTPETALHRDLATRFDYDGIWGTVLNRFCAQAAIGLPLSVHGKGGQTRGFLDIRDTVACVELAAVNPPAAGEYRVFNQFTEQFSILDLATRVHDARAAHGLQTEIVHQRNPRVEADTHYYNAKHQHLLDLGLHPHALADTLIEDVISLVQRHASRVRPHTLVTAVDWRTGGDVYRSPDGVPIAALGISSRRVAEELARASGTLIRSALAESVASSSGRRSAP
jgi:UDP-sulfoquinovose synthase